MQDIILLKKSQTNQSVRVLTAAFADYAMWKALFPNDKERNRMIPVLWRGVVAYCRRYGMVEATSDFTGIAARVKPRYAHLTPWRHIRSGFLLPRAVMMLSMKSRVRFLRVMSQIDKMHRQLMPEPHWYLWVVGINPASQGHGIGGNLLTSGVAQAQQARMPCYLETQTEDNVAFYQKRGFEVLREVTFPEIDLKQWFMRKAAV